MAECSNSERKWTCSLCTYRNFPNSLKCTVCLAPQGEANNLTLPLTIEDAAAGFSGNNFSSVSHRYAISSEDADGVDNALAAMTEMIIDDKRWSCPSCTYLNCLRTKKCIQCCTDRPLRYSSDPSLDSVRESWDGSFKQSSPTGQLPLSANTNVLAKALNKWSCHMCTFLNWPNAVRCTMCGAVKAQSPKPVITGELKPLKIDYHNTGYDGRNELPLGNVRNVSPSDLNNTDKYTSSLDIYMRRYAAHDPLESAFFKAASSIRKGGEIDAVDCVVEYLINEGNLQRQFSSFEARLLNLRGFLRAPPFEAGDSLLDIAKRCDSVDLVKLMRRCAGGENDSAEKLACALNCASRNRIYAKVAQCMAVRNGNFNAQFIAQPYNFNVLKFPMLVTDHNLEIMKAIFKPAPSIPPAYCFVDCYDTRGSGAQNILGRPPNFLLKNRGGGYSLCDALFQSMFGVCDRYNILRTALKYTMVHSDHCFKPRWCEYYARMARDCGITLNVNNMENDWEEALNATANEDDALEPIHIFILAHVLCRPIVVVSTNYPILLDDADHLADRSNFNGSTNNNKDDEDLNASSVASASQQQQSERKSQMPLIRCHAVEGVYLPILWASPPVTRSPVVIAHRNGNFYAVVVSDGLYQRDRDVQRFLNLNYSRRYGNNLFRFLTVAEMGNSNLLAQFISMAICCGSNVNYSSIAIRRDPHPFLYESLFFYANWTSAVYCCNVEDAGELKMSQLERHIDTVPYDFPQLQQPYNDDHHSSSATTAAVSRKFSIFSAKALSVLRRNHRAATLAVAVADSSVSEPITVLDSSEDEDEEEDDDEEEEDNESLAYVPS